MSQGQPRRPRSEEAQTDPIKYGEVFPASGDLSGKPIAPLDASMMQAAENIVLGHTQKGGLAAVMQSAAARNVRAGLVGHKTATDVAGEEGVTLEETTILGSVSSVHRIRSWPGIVYYKGKFFNKVLGFCLISKKYISFKTF